MTFSSEYDSKLLAELVELLQDEGTTPKQGQELTIPIVKSSLKKPSNLLKLAKLDLFYSVGSIVGEITNRKEEDSRMDYCDFVEAIKNEIIKVGKKNHLSDEEVNDIMEGPNCSSVLQNIENNAESIVIVVKSQCLKDFDEKHYLLKASLLKNRELKDSKIKDKGFVVKSKIDPNALFSDQLSVHSLGSGFFISPNIIATAAHILFPNDSLSTNFCFIKGLRKELIGGLTKGENGEQGVLIRKENVFRPVEEGEKPTCYDYTETRQDWAVLKVKSDTDGGSPHYARLEHQRVGYGQKVYCFGHGLGLPLKISYGGMVIKNRSKYPFYECQLATFAGNSGSPIFDCETHKVIGILIRGTHQLELIDEEKRYFQPRRKPCHHEGEECQKLAPVIAALSKLS